MGGPDPVSTTAVNREGAPTTGPSRHAKLDEDIGQNAFARSSERQDSLPPGYQELKTDQSMVEAPGNSRSTYRATCFISRLTRVPTLSFPSVVTVYV